jgi:uncharacterized damage-inducible protein DinB
MDTVEYIKNSLAFAHRALSDACNGTDEQLHFVPTGGSHSIAWCLWHTARIEDVIINGRCRGADLIWNESTANQVGLPFDGTGNGLSDDEAQQIRIADIEAFRAYQASVWKQSDEFLDSLSDDDLQRAIPRRDGSTETIAQAISLHLIGHFNGHRGEINLLRGMQGMPGVLVSEGTH